MNSTEVPPTRVRTAIALSIVAHICALSLLALLLRNRCAIVSSALDAGPALIVTTVERRTTVGRRVTPRSRPSTALANVTIVTRPMPRAARTAPPNAQAISYEIVRPRVPQVQAAPRGLVRGPTARRLPQGPGRASLALGAPPRTLTPTDFPGLVWATPARTRNGTPAPTPAPVPTPSATPTSRPRPAVTSTPPAALAANFGGLFSQNYPPALSAPSALAAIRSRLSGPVRIRIDVDETGRATEVRFVAPVSDPGLEQDIRSTLLALHYVPADCNGLHCDGTLEIAY